MSRDWYDEEPWYEPGTSGAQRHHSRGSATLASVRSILLTHLLTSEGWLLFEDRSQGTVFILLFRQPLAIESLEEELRATLPAGVLLDLLLVQPDIDREVVDSCARLGGVDAVRRLLNG